MAIAASLVFASCMSSPEIDGVLDCEVVEDRNRFFEVSDLIGDPTSIPIGSAREEIAGLDPDDQLIYAGPRETDSEGPDAGDLVIIRDGHEVAWFSFVEHGGEWDAQRGSVCPETSIRMSDGL